MKAPTFNSTLKFTSFLLIFFISINTFAQQTVKASDILKDLKKGKNITYKDVTITGVLDMTYMDEKLPDLPRKKRWWKNNGSNVVKETIDSKISFINCTFKDDVLAYIHDESTGYTFTASFDDDVRFKNCQFKRDAMFKYSDFEGNVDFSDSKFEENTTFKYAKFDHRTSFANTVFKENAIFKYSEFNDGVSFKNARFEDDLNIKYTEVSGTFNIAGMKVANEINSKYTAINGKGFSKYLLENN